MSEAIDKWLEDTHLVSMEIETQIKYISLLGWLVMVKLSYAVSLASFPLYFIFFNKAPDRKIGQPLNTWLINKLPHETKAASAELEQLSKHIKTTVQNT